VPTDSDIAVSLRDMAAPDAGVADGDSLRDMAPPDAGVGDPIESLA
jgi:hypothetical protein